MHVRGKDFEYKLVYPDGTSKILLSVPRYDFNWQLVYFMKEPVAAPKGSRTALRITTIPNGTSSIRTRPRKSAGVRRPGKR